MFILPYLDIFFLFSGGSYTDHLLKFPIIMLKKSLLPENKRSFSSTNGKTDIADCFVVFFLLR